MIELLVNNGALLDYRVGYSLGAKTPLQIAAVNGKIRSVRVIDYYYILEVDLISDMD